MPTDQANFVTGNGRPRVHASDSGRVAAYRKTHVRLDLVLSQDLGSTIDDLSLYLDCSKNELVGSLVRFALTNRNWRVQGLYGRQKKC